MSRVDEMKAEVGYTGYQNVPPDWRCLFPESGVNFCEGIIPLTDGGLIFISSQQQHCFDSSGREIIPRHTIST
ncbi:hypothetical protein QQF64_021757 [Cirrhinus molitorella]|uniref:Uncharacterized protein n=1 Tax=Cirrhinus molitorella TaxID=172907 RepID=A0ABR3L9R8_9TELE